MRSTLPGGPRVGSGREAHHTATNVTVSEVTCDPASHRPTETKGVLPFLGAPAAASSLRQRARRAPRARVPACTCRRARALSAAQSASPGAEPRRVRPSVSGQVPVLLVTPNRMALVAAYVSADPLLANVRAACTSAVAWCALQPLPSQCSALRRLSRRCPAPSGVRMSAFPSRAHAPGTGLSAGRAPPRCPRRTLRAPFHTVAWTSG